MLNATKQLVVLLICWLYHSSQKTTKSHLSRHGGKVPHAADDSPAAHHPQQIIHHAKLAAVPESIAKQRIILQDRITDLSGVGRSKMSRTGKIKTE